LLFKVTSLSNNFLTGLIKPFLGDLVGYSIEKLTSAYSFSGYLTDNFAILGLRLGFSFVALNEKTFYSTAILLFTSMFL